MEIIIVTRHNGLVDWLNKRNITGRVISNASVGDLEGNIVYGILPTALAAKCKQYFEVAMTIPPEWRGKEFTAEQMDDWGATLYRYEIAAYVA